jgi:transcriptional antiterminator RfaH
MTLGQGELSRDREREEHPSVGGAKRWLCVQSQPRKEMFAVENLRAQSYHCFLPMVSKVVRHARKVRTVRVPLFPRYMFVSIDLSVEPWRPILSTFGVSAIVRGRDRPKPVPVGVVEALLRAKDAQGLIDFRHEVRVGQQVRIMSGPFFNLVGQLERMDERGRVEVLLSILGGERSVATVSAALQPVPA